MTENKSAFQMLVLCLAGWVTFMMASIPTLPVQAPAVVSASKLDLDVHSVLSSASKEDKENIYKVFSGVVDYCNNSKRTHSNRDVEGMITEVILTYKLENFTSLDAIIKEEIKKEGLEKNEKLAENKAKLAKVFGGLANAVKYSIEKGK